MTFIAFSSLITLVFFCFWSTDMHKTFFLRINFGRRFTWRLINNCARKVVMIYLDLTLKLVCNFSYKTRNVLRFFQQNEKLFHFFHHNTKSVSIFSAKCTKCFNLFNKSKWNNCTFFLQMQNWFQFFQAHVENLALSYYKCEKCLTLF